MAVTKMAKGASKNAIVTLNKIIDWLTHKREKALSWLVRKTTLERRQTEGCGKAN